MNIYIKRSLIYYFTLTLIASLLNFQGCNAQSTSYAADQSGNPTNLNSISLFIPVTAIVSPVCASTAALTASLDLGTLDRALPDTQVALNIQCSGAFHMGLTSGNGGLKSAAVTPAGYTSLRDYKVTLHIRDNANTDYSSLTCTASALVSSASGSACSNNIRGPATGASPSFMVNGPSTGNGSYLTISDAPLTTNILVAATDYIDTLTISITAAT